MAKNYPTPPDKLISRIRNHRNDQIYLTVKTATMCKWNTLEGYYFLASSDNYVINGKHCVRLELVDDEDSRLYTFPKKGKIRLY